MRELALQDIHSAQEAVSNLRQHLRSLVIEPQPVNEAGALLEIKAGVGGGESAIFVGDLLRMYTRLAQRNRWKADLVESTAMTGNVSKEAYREVLLEVKGRGAYGLLKKEIGVHRVQRVPATETQGRVHTSTAAVIVSQASP